VFLAELTIENLSGLYSFVSVPTAIHTDFLGIINLLEPSIILALLAASAQFILSKTMFSKRKQMGTTATSGMQAMMGKQMIYVLPLVTFFIAQSFPAGLVLYWFITTVFSFGQQLVINKSIENKMGATT